MKTLRAHDVRICPRCDRPFIPTRAATRCKNCGEMLDVEEPTLTTRPWNPPRVHAPRLVD